MTRKNLLSSIIALFAITFIMLVSGTSSASAQQSLKCCTYRVEIQGVPLPCLPISLWASWYCNPGGFINSTTYTANGSYTEPVIAIPAPCPPSCTLKAISLDGGATVIGPNESGQFMVNNCCYVMHYGFDADGCIVIKITRC